MEYHKSEQGVLVSSDVYNGMPKINDIWIKKMKSI